MAFLKSYPWSLLCMLISTLTTCSRGHPSGHLQPLGSHQPPAGDVLSVNDVPSPQEFFTKYVKPGKPVLFKGAATKSPAYSLWTDNYLSSKYGDLKVDVEEGKKENRSKELFNMSLRKFLKIYNESDVYLVHSLPYIMRGDIFLLKCLLCGGYTNSLHDSVMWFSNGGTKSVLHYDAIDNINCLMSGTKELFMVDKREKARINIDSPTGSFSQVDVDKVDLYKYPGLIDVPWYRAWMDPGDCLFIPYRWFHQVRSFGPRNLAINIWFQHMHSFNTTDCETSLYKGQEFAPLSAFDVSGHLQEHLTMTLVDEMDGAPLKENEWMEIFEKLWLRMLDKPDLKVTARNLVKNLFITLDENKDLMVSPEEVMNGKLADHEEKLTALLNESDGVEDGEGETEDEDEDEDEDSQEKEDWHEQKEVPDVEHGGEHGDFKDEVRRDDL